MFCTLSVCCLSSVFAQFGSLTIFRTGKKRRANRVKDVRTPDQTFFRLREPESLPINEFHAEQVT